MPPRQMYMFPARQKGRWNIAYSLSQQGFSNGCRWWQADCSFTLRERRAERRADTAAELKGAGYDTTGHICRWLPGYFVMVDVHARRTGSGSLRNYLPCVRGIHI